MTPPRALWCIEWLAARRDGSPQHVLRTYTDARRAARQYASLLHDPCGAWLRDRVHVVGVWSACGYDELGIEWTPFYGPAHLQPFTYTTHDMDDV